MEPHHLGFRALRKATPIDPKWKGPGESELAMPYIMERGSDVQSPWQGPGQSSLSVQTSCTQTRVLTAVPASEGGLSWKVTSTSTAITEHIPLLSQTSTISK